MTDEEREKTESQDAVEENGMEGLARPGKVDCRAIFLGWEKLRIPFNIALVLLPVLSGVFMTFWPGRDVFGSVAVDKRIVFSVALFAIAANMFFFLGPLTEVCVAWLAHKTYMFELRLCLFASCTIASISLAMLCVLKYSQFLFPD